MKKIKKIYTLLFAACVAMGSVSCTDYLDKAPGSDIDPVDPYKNYTNFQGFMEQCYNCIPALAGTPNYHGNWNYGEDEYWQPSETRMLSNAIDQGNYWAWNDVLYSPFHAGNGSPTGYENNNKGNLWGMAWYGIYTCNLGLSNLDKLTDATQEEKNIIAGQLYFFRGFFHFQIMQYWGGIPYIDFLIPSDAVFNYPRLTYQEDADKVAADLQKAVDLLPLDWDKTTVGKQTLGKNKFRPNKIAALCFLGKNYLWAGSPLMNEVSKNGDNANFKNVNNYDKDYCQKAAEAFGEALKLNKQAGLYELAKMENYTDLFYTLEQGEKIPGMKEVIFYENANNKNWVWNEVTDFRPTSLIQSGIKVCPTANYVDYFGMANGKPIKDITKKDPDSGYDPEYPFKNRDPRFYSDFIYDGVKCVKNGSKVDGNDTTQYASLFTGGIPYTDQKTQTYRQTSKGSGTGYLLKKFCDPYRNDYDDGGARAKAMVVHMAMIRLADVYLMYAESVAQGYGDFNASSKAFNLKALAALNIVRERAGIDDVADEYLQSMDGFMSELRRERAVELAFEGHRFTDLRRWLLIDKAPYTTKSAVYFDRASDQSKTDRYDNPQRGHVLNLKEEPLIVRQFTTKHYWFPFLRKDCNIYPEFKQNPGWK